jgi:hypothetical protein
MTRFLQPALFLVLGGLAAAAWAADPLGRLFFTPDERERLERQRARPPAEAKPSLPGVTVNGVVQRSDGKAVVWVNGVPRPASAPAAENGLAARPLDAATVVVTTPEGKVQVKVGETVWLAPGEGRGRGKETPLPSTGVSPEADR